MNATFPVTIPVTISREYPPAPLVAVAAVALDDAGRALMVKRGRPPSKGLWALPGGLLDLGEAARDGVVREVREETGAEIEIVDLLGLFEPIHRDADGRIRYHYVVIDFWAHFRGGKVTPADDADDVAWVSLASLDDLPMEEATRRAIRKAHVRWRRNRQNVSDQGAETPQATGRRPPAADPCSLDNPK